MSVPTCCGKKMTMSLETTKFVEVQCEQCGDIVFVKKDDAPLPQLLDD